jgi:hypothetical protein
MPGGEGQQALTPERLVRDLITAIFDGRTEDVVALAHPGVVWRPVTRPGLSAYHGHAGTARMVADIAAAYGPGPPDIVAIGQDAPGQVTVEARIVRAAGPSPLIRSVFTLEDGLVKSMESSYPAGPPDEQAAAGDPAAHAAAKAGPM